VIAFAIKLSRRQPVYDLRSSNLPDISAIFASHLPGIGDMFWFRRIFSTRKYDFDFEEWKMVAKICFQTLRCLLDSVAAKMTVILWEQRSVANGEYYGTLMLSTLLFLFINV
jgi:hypothetical protein